MPSIFDTDLPFEIGETASATPVLEGILITIGAHRFLFSEPATLDQLVGQLKTVQAVVQRWQKNI